jgi:hypothetical protein
MRASFSSDVYLTTKYNVMKKAADNSDSKSGTEFQKHQRAVDKGLNEKIKNEGDSGSDDSNAIEQGKRNHSTDVSTKKTGGGKQKSPGD